MKASAWIEDGDEWDIPIPAYPVEEEVRDEPVVEQELSWDEPVQEIYEDDDYGAYNEQEGDVVEKKGRGTNLIRGELIRMK